MQKIKKIAFLLSVMLCITACGKEDAKETSSDAVSLSSSADRLLRTETAVVNDNAPGSLPGADGAVLRGAAPASGALGAAGERPDPDAEPLPGDKDFHVHAIYITGAVAGISRMDDLIALADETDVNAFVIDIKNDAGEVTYPMDTPTVREIGTGVNYVADMEALVAKCKEHGIYLIARIVAFKDPALAKAVPEYALHTADGQLFHDNSGLAWVNPYEQGVWDYLMEIAAEAARIGFDEIQFDYIRFSTDKGMESVVFGEGAESRTKTDIINDFTIYAHETLSPLSVIVSADVFGTIIDNTGDREIVGQDYAAMASNLDIICPMIYPSHYSAGVYQIDVPDAEPYRAVYGALDASRTALQQYGQDTVCALLENGLPAHSRVRPWLQAFTATWVSGHIEYGREQIQEQIRAVHDAGYDEWIFWNASAQYDPAWF